MSSLSKTSVLGHFFFNFKGIIIDEIALDGLEGIGLDMLWKRVERRISTPLTDKMKIRFWTSMLHWKEISMYQLPEPLPMYEIQDRFMIVDEETGDIKDPNDYLDGPYEYSPVTNEYGSCKYYNTRKFLPSQELLNLNYQKVMDEYGQTLVLVACLEERWRALAQHEPITCIQQMMPLQYCILELIGKSRENGQMTIGKTNLTKIIKEPKNLFYNRRCLKVLGLIKVVCLTQTMGFRGVKSLLLRLNRFHQPSVLSVPKIGKTHKILEYLKNCPKYSAKSDHLYQMGMYTRPQAKRIKKNNNVFAFVEHCVEDDEPPKKKAKLSPAALPKKQRFLCIVSKSDESSQSEEEVIEEPVKCQFKVGVGLMRQAYERLLEAGLKGLSQSELGQKLGLGFYTTRMLCRIMKGKNIVREFFEDKGKQRISRYVAMTTGHCDTTYIEERNKFLENMAPNTLNTEREAIPSTSSVSEIPKSEDKGEELTEIENEHISVVTASEQEKNAFKSLVDSRKSMTLRQLRFGNGVIKIVKERQCISGYQTVSNLVAKEINEPPMVTKALKSFLCKLVAAGKVKIYRIRWPGTDKYVSYINLICAPNVKITDPIVRSKYKEIHVRAMARKNLVKKETVEPVCRPLSMFVNPRYMKIQKLHEAIIKITYFNRPPDLPHRTPGFMSMTDLMPEMTVKFAISNMSNTGMSEISHLRIFESHLNMKLKDAPAEIAHGIIKCKSLKNAMRLNLKSLAMFGLIQLIYIPDVQTANYTNSTLSSFLFYVNRNARIVNTSGNWPRTANVQDLERKYYFETFDDVKTFWRDVFDISTDTKIVIKDERAKKTLSPPVRREDEVETYDNGDRYGDGKGPCGFDSCFYMEIARLWRTFYVRDRPKKTSKKKAQVTIPKIPKPKKPRAHAKRKVQRKVNPIMKLKVVTKNRKRIPETTITWTKLEDSIIILCQAAITIASPTSQPGCLRIRNTVAKDILSLSDTKKTQSVCHRRSMMLQLNVHLMHEKESLLNEMKRRRHLILKYEGLLKKLRLKYSTNMTKFMNEAKLPVMELVWLIWQVSKSESYNHRLPCVAMDVKDFYEHFTIVPATANKVYNLYKTPELGVLREAVFLTIMLTFRNDVRAATATLIYSIFKAYPEQHLRTVIDQLRRSGAVSAKEKLFNNQMHRLHLEDIVQSAYKISASYQRRWISRLNSDYVNSLDTLIKADMPTTPFKGSAEMNCILCELHCSNLIDIVTATKPAVVDNLGQQCSKGKKFTVIDIESKFYLKSGLVAWKKKANSDDHWDSKSVSSLYDDIEFESILQHLEKTADIAATNNEQYDMEDVIVEHLERKGDKGSSFEELQDITGLETQHLVQRLTQLESDTIVKRVGTIDNTIILLKYIKDWALKLENKYIIVTPWITLECKIRYNIFLEWTGVIVNKVFEWPGCSIAYLSDSFELITPKAVQDACMFLQHIKCVELKIEKCKEPDLYSDPNEERIVSEFHPYESVNNIMVYPFKNTITKYAYLRKKILDKYEKTMK